MTKLRTPGQREPGRWAPLARKLLWFLALYAAGVAVVAAVAYGLRAILFP